ncbi:MAG: transposase [Arthrobacter sp.]|nr:transposase [Arthrobacter sp.]
MFTHVMASIEVPRTGGGRPVSFDAEANKGRAAVEQSFSLFKQWRGIATRFDKLALTYRAGIALYAVLIWLRGVWISFMEVDRMRMTDA